MVEVRPHHISAIDGEPDLRKEQATLDAGDSRSVRKDRQEKKTLEQIRNETLHAMMSEERNRRWFYEVLEACHIGQNIFSSDPLRMAFNAGESNIGLQIFAQLQGACPDLYLKMMEEKNG